MKRIPLFKNRLGEIAFYAIIDNEDFDFLNQWKWYSQNKVKLARIFNWLFGACVHKWEIVKKK